MNSVANSIGFRGRVGSLGAPTLIGRLVNQDTHTYLSEKELRGVFNANNALRGNSFITYCGGGVAASSDALALTLLGIQDVAVYHEGLIEWTADPELPMEVG